MKNMKIGDRKPVRLFRRFNDVDQAYQLRSKMNSKYLCVTDTASSGLRRVTSLHSQRCHRVSMFIAVCMLFLMLVAGSDVLNQSEKHNATKHIRSSVMSRPPYFLHGPIYTRDVNNTHATPDNESDVHIPRSDTLSPTLFCVLRMHGVSRPARESINRIRSKESINRIRSKESINRIRTDKAGIRHRPILDQHHNIWKPLTVEDNKVLCSDKRLIIPISRRYSTFRARSDESKFNVVYRGAKQGRLLREKPVLLKDNLEREFRTDAVHNIAFSLRSKSSHFTMDETREKAQIRKMVEALRNSTLFATMAGIIEGMNLWMLPQFVTIFTPTDSAYQTVQNSGLNQMELFLYHTVLQRYDFNQLCAFNEGAVLYSMLPGYTVLVTEKRKPFKICLDGVHVIAPDLYLDETIAVHGIGGVFNSTVYGKSFGGHIVPIVAPPPLPSNPLNFSGKLPPTVLPSPKESESKNGSTVGGDQEGNSVQQSAPNPDSDAADSQFPSSPMESEVATNVTASGGSISVVFPPCCVAAFLFHVRLNFWR